MEGVIWLLVFLFFVLCVGGKSMKGLKFFFEFWFVCLKELSNVFCGLVGLWLRWLGFIRKGFDLRGFLKIEFGWWLWEFRNGREYCELFCLWFIYRLFCEFWELVWLWFWRSFVYEFWEVWDYCLLWWLNMLFL